MALAIFDLDDTLLAGDSASLWLEYMVNTGMAPFSMLATEQAMMQQYRKGALDMSAYLDFTLAPLRGLSVSEIQERVEQFVTHMIAPRIYPEGIARLDWHRQRGDIPLL
ncbi:MAG: HAD family hydrolase, partial [Plesiomonas shigelloides]